ncbi:MAG: thioredoxin [Flavobacteriia bacterium]|nr:thioredoxin [Bacteroidota bacterium]NDE29046.1 thioredoxin [Flavobacteriia bacterium]
MSAFETILKGDELVLIDFFATWCGPCKMMSPILDQLKKRSGNKVRILKVDVDKNPKIAASYQVRGVPTLVLMKSETILWRQSGVVELHALEQVLQQHQ